MVWASYIPWISLAGLVALAISARLRLGEWPKAMHWKVDEPFPTAANIDPKQIGWLYAATLIGIGLSFLLALMAPLLSTVLPASSKVPLLRTLVGAATLLLFMWANPFDLWNWFLD